jgi:hypothetical protein
VKNLAILRDLSKSTCSFHWGENGNFRTTGGLTKADINMEAGKTGTEK